MTLERVMLGCAMLGVGVHVEGRSVATHFGMIGTGRVRGLVCVFYHSCVPVQHSALCWYVKAIGQMWAHACDTPPSAFVLTFGHVYDSCAFAFSCKHTCDALVCAFTFLCGRICNVVFAFLCRTQL